MNVLLAVLAVIYFIKAQRSVSHNMDEQEDWLDKLKNLMRLGYFVLILFHNKYCRAFLKVNRCYWILIGLFRRLLECIVSIDRNHHDTWLNRMIEWNWGLSEISVGFLYVTVRKGRWKNCLICGPWQLSFNRHSVYHAGGGNVMAQWIRPWIHFQEVPGSNHHVAPLVPRQDSLYSLPSPVERV